MTKPAISSRDGGPAFPGEYVLHERGEIGNQVPIMAQSSGMSLRDWFAGQALAGVLANTNLSPSAKEASAIAFNVADHMLEKRAGAS